MKRFISMVLVLVMVFAIMPTYTAFAADSPKNGTYVFTQGGKAINVYANYVSDIKNNVKINMWEQTRHETQEFSITKTNGAYKIMTAKKNYTLNVTALKAKSKVICYKDSEKNTEYFLIEPEGDGYSIRPKNSPSLALTATGGTSLELKKYTGAKNQVFALKKAGKEASAAVKIKLNVPVMRTYDTRWKNTVYHKATKATIGEYGCLITAISMALSAKDNATYTPADMIKKLTFSKNAGVLWSYGEAKRFKSNVAYSLETVKRELEKGNPVLVKGKNGSNQHWCVVTGVNAPDGRLNAGQFTIIDPSFKTNTTLKHFISDYPQGNSIAVLK